VTISSVFNNGARTEATPVDGAAKATPGKAIKIAAVSAATAVQRWLLRV
jgi:hypothetical protein